MSSQVFNDQEPIQSGSTTDISGAGETAKPKQSTEQNRNVHISTLEDLKKQAPEVYQQMMIGIGMSVCKDMEKGQARLKELMRKAREDT